VALVTGAGSGIGRATALALAREGASLVLCDVSPARLEVVTAEVDAVSRCVHAAVVDVGDREAMRAFSEAVHLKMPAVDVLVNNAGVGHSGGVLTTSLEDWDRVLRVNVLGVIHGCHFFVPTMLRHGGGHVVNLSSALGYAAAPNVLGYVTSKFAVLGYSRALRAELKGQGVGVTAVCPGVVHTNIVKDSHFAGVPDEAATRARVDALYARRGYPPERVAEAIVGAIRRDTAVLPVTPEAWFLYYLSRVSPGAQETVARWMSRRMVQG
jgi:short-subunit dehydrogenase